MGRNSFLKFPNKEEQLVPDSIDATDHQFLETNGDYYDPMDDQFKEGVLGIKDDQELGEGSNNIYDDHDLMNWNFMDSEEFSFSEVENGANHKVDDSSLHFDMVKRENCEFWDEDEETKKMCLNLSLNYQDVMDAWSDRGSLWAEDCSPSPDANNGYMGEVPIIEEDRTRREASVLRYKEKRQNRLFAKKIRYQVRKLNADNRPRLKGRFVKRDS